MTMACDISSSFLKMPLLSLLTMVVCILNQHDYTGKPLLLTYSVTLRFSAEWKSVTGDTSPDSTNWVIQQKQGGCSGRRPLSCSELKDSIIEMNL